MGATNVIIERKWQDRLRTDRHLGRVAVVVASLAILLAPFIAFLYAPEAGLSIMAAALTFTAISFETRLSQRAPVPPDLALLVGVDLMLALVCVLVLIVLVAHG